MTFPGRYALSDIFNRFVRSEAVGGHVLAACALLALAIANSPVGGGYLDFWQLEVAGLSIGHWVNDGLMAVFFLMIGLELERAIYVGELSKSRDALLPIFAAVGGMLAPALIHLAFTRGTPASVGFGIPMATDIAFALAVLALLGTRVPAALKVFVVAFAVMDDLGAILVIAAFYSSDLSFLYLASAFAVWGLLIGLNRLGRVQSLPPYLIGGALMWFLMLRSGVHATLAGVLLAFAVPFTARDGGISPSERLEHTLHHPVAFVVLPVFALANTGIVIGPAALQGLAGSNGLGILAGLCLGKPLGVLLLCAAAVALGLCRLPEGVRWTHIAGAGMLGGIGFTMSIFVANLAFAGAADAIDASKLAVLTASLVSGAAGFFLLRLAGRPVLASKE